MSRLKVAAVSHHFGRDLEHDFDEIAGLLEKARSGGARLVVLPEAALGGYLSGLDDDPDDLPPALDPDGKEIERLARLARSSAPVSRRNGLLSGIR